MMKSTCEGTTDWSDEWGRGEGIIKMDDGPGMSHNDRNMDSKNKIA